MPIYSCTVKGEKTPRIVRADTAAQAKSHIVDVKAMTADEMADAIEGGANIETAAKAEAKADGEAGEEK